MKITSLFFATLVGALLTGCESLYAPPIRKNFVFDEPIKALKITVDYGPLRFGDYGLYQICAGRVTVHNYGTNNYRNIVMNFSFYDDGKNLIATDSFCLMGGLVAGGTVTIQPDRYNPLDQAGSFTQSFGSCPPTMNQGHISIIAN